MPQRTRHARVRPARLTQQQGPGYTDGTAPAGQPGPGQQGGGPQGTPSRLTARGAGLAMFSVFFPGTLTAGWLHLAALTGLSFVAGCILAGLYTKRAHLLTVATMPPMIFMASLICVKAISSTGNAVISTAEGSILTLSAVAPWLFAGTAATLVIALFRGLPQNISDLRAGLRGNLESGDPGDGWSRS